MEFFMKSITLLAQSTMTYRDKVFSPMGISGAQVKYLLGVAGDEGISQDMLAKKMMINKSNVARQLSALEENGYIRREQSAEDKRVMLVYTTDKGKAIVPDLRKENKRWREIVCEGLTKEEKVELALLLDKLIANARAYLGCEL
ncbi:MAG: MarR family winged helix-turn-helix transcriptional regulator [Candidatus Coproplasma sp.]